MHRIRHEHQFVASKPAGDWDIWRGFSASLGSSSCSRFNNTHGNPYRQLTKPPTNHLITMNWPSLSIININPLASYSINILNQYQAFWNIYCLLRTRFWHQSLCHSKTSIWYDLIRRTLKDTQVYSAQKWTKLVLTNPTKMDPYGLNQRSWLDHVG